MKKMRSDSILIFLFCWVHVYSINVPKWLLKGKKAVHSVNPMFVLNQWFFYILVAVYLYVYLWWYF